MSEREEWRTVGQTEYRAVEPAEILKAVVVNADHDTIYLQKGERKFAVYLNGQDRPIHEYRAKEET